jgi:hypothetical protein
MIQKIEICSQCFDRKPVNSRGICPDCIFRNNHNSKSKQEIYSERSKLKQESKINVIHAPKVKPLKHSKTSPLLKNERLEKRRDIIQLDEETYEEVFRSRPDRCEECGKPLPDVFRDGEGKIVYRAQYSHILSKAAWPEFRHNSKNFNRLCLFDHDCWEFGERQMMAIFIPNQVIIQEMLNEKNNLQ